MSRPSTVHKYLGHEIGGITLLRELGVRDGRMWVECLCSQCERLFEAKFHNIYKGQYKSCGCQRFGTKSQGNRWQGRGEISKSYFSSLERGANTRNLDFSISIEQVWELFLKQEKKCALSKIPLSFSTTRKSHDGTASLDRINPKIGYNIENVQWVHKDLNYMKQSMTNEEFLNWVKVIYESK